MPIILKVDHEGHYVDSVAIGSISYANVENHLLTERYFKGLTYKEFIDARGAGISFTPAESRQIVELLQNLGRESKLGPTAVLVSNDVAFGVIRMLEVLVEDACDVKPFREEQEARAWLAMQ